LVIFVAGMWYQRWGGLTTAVAAVGAYASAYCLGSDLPLSWANIARVAYSSGVIAFPVMGFAVGLLFETYSREVRQRTEMAHEISLARWLQEGLLPKAPPQLPGWEIAAAMRPAREVGGDMYEFLNLPDGTLLIALADMAGKGVYGTVHLSMLHSHLRAAAARQADLAAVASEVNERTYPELQPDSYAAAVFIKIAPWGTQASFVNCGHSPPLLHDPRTGTLVELSSGDPVIGARKEYQYRQATVDISPGALLLCYTDGLVEARSRSGARFGEEGIRSLVQSYGHLPAARLCEVLLEQVSNFSRDTPADDQVVIAVRRLPAQLGVASPEAEGPGAAPQPSGL
jgi:sigma-B regulation protein RsbU (phosphoserine phosphatase)